MTMNFLILFSSTVQACASVATDRELNHGVLHPRSAGRNRNHALAPPPVLSTWQLPSVEENDPVGISCTRVQYTCSMLHSQLTGDPRPWCLSPMSPYSHVRSDGQPAKGSTTMLMRKHIRIVASLIGATLTFAVATRMVTSSVAVDVVTYHNDNARTGQNLSETILTPATVNTTTFGKTGFFPVDGKVDAQPLFLSGVAIPGLGTHDLLYVASR